MKRIDFLAIPLIATMLLAPTVLADDVTVSATVSGYITATFNYAAVSYGSLSAGTSNNAAPNQLNGVYNVTVDANNNYKVQAYGLNFTDGGGHEFYINNLKMDSNATAGNLAVGSAVALTEVAQTIETNILPAVTTHYHGYWLSIPAGQYGAAYSSTVTETYSLV